MGTLFRTCAIGWAMTIPFAVAWAQAPGSFDGVYAGVSAAHRGSMSGSGRSCPQFPAPSPLMVSGGRAQLKWGESSLQGDVSPQGSVVARAPTTGQLQAQIDAQGRVAGTYTGYCTYELVWQKRR